jgi:hypothetical protein
MIKSFVDKSSNRFFNSTQTNINTTDSNRFAKSKANTVSIYLDENAQANTENRTSTANQCYTFGTELQSQPFGSFVASEHEHFTYHTTDDMWPI